MQIGTGHRRSLNPGSGMVLFLLLGLLSGCASTGDQDASPEPPEIADAVPKVEPKSKYGNPKSYVVFGKRYYTKASSKGHVERGLASWYGKKFHGRRTSSGERYDMYDMTAAHKSLPLPTYARVTNMTNGRSAVVKINDRGPFHGKRIIDLSFAAARKLGVVEKGVAMVEVKAIDPRRPASGDETDDMMLAADEEFEIDTGGRTRTVAGDKMAPSRSTSVVAKAQKPRTTPKSAPIQVVETAKPSEPKPVADASVSEQVGDSAPQVAMAVTEVRPRAAAGTSTYLQVGAFGSRMNAEQLRSQLVDQLVEQVQVLASDGKQQRLYRVHVGPLDSRKRAVDLSRQLASLGLDGSHIVVGQKQ